METWSIVLLLLIILFCGYKFLARNEVIKRRIFAKLWLSGLSKQIDRALYLCKKELMKRVELEGDLLEVGSGDGINLKYYLDYSDRIHSLTCIEPNKEFNDRANSRNASFPIHNFNGTFSDFLASSEKKVSKFNVVILCLILCSIEDPTEVLNECHQLLAPGGRLLVLEHVRDQESSLIVLLQHILNPLWKIVGDNCCLTTQPYLHIRSLKWTKFSEEMMRAVKSKIPVLKQFYSCVATK